MYKLGLMQSLGLRWSDLKALQAERARLLAEIAAQSVLATASAPADAPVPNPSSLQAGSPAVLSESNPALLAEPPAPMPADHNNHLIAGRNAPPPLATPGLGAALNSAGTASVRGKCDGCGTNVMSNDEGRRREGLKYFHEACVKGDCGRCGLIVHSRTLDRELHNGIYYHPECVR
jgi:hypothetical protein